jgi:hypothetical protein
MKRIDQEQKSGASFSSSSSSSSSTSANRSDGVMEYWSVGIQTSIHFCGLRLELFARSVMNSETVLPKAVKTAGLMNPRLNWGYASDASPRRAATISLERRVVSKQ